MPNSSSLTADEIAETAHYLTETRDAVAASAEGLSAAQWAFKPSPDRWSIAENFEHLILMEQRIHTIPERLATAPEPPPDWDPAKMDALIRREVPNRGQKADAPPFTLPTHGWSLAESLEYFFAGRAKTIELLSCDSLRGRVLPHPIFGPWDGYHWLTATGAHSLRHAAQMREVRNSPDFPQ